MEPTNTGIKAWQWIVTAVVVIVLIILGVWVFGGKSSAPSSTEMATTTDMGTDNSGQPAAVNRIIMADQYPGNVVYISSVQLANPGWVAIYTNTAGRLGEVIGQAYFSSGINPGKINLSKPMIDGGSYFAVLLSDNGDKKFDLATDLPLKDDSGNVIMKPFRALSTMNAEVKG